MNKFLRKNNWIVIILSILGILLVLGLFSTLFTNDKVDDNGKIVVKPTFSEGCLNETGKYVKAEDKLYTKESFECIGLETILDFEAECTYEVYFYDENDEMVGSKVVLDQSLTHVVPEGAVAARIVIIPEWDADVAKDDQVITIFNKSKYVNMLKIKVLEDQTAKTTE